MNNLIKWSELSDKDKVQLILQHVFHCVFVKNENTIDYFRGTKEFHWPVCFWDANVGCWFLSWGDPMVFDPLHDLNAVWKIMDYLKPGRVDLSHMEQETHESFMCRTIFVTLLNDMDGWWSWAQEKMCNSICFAALKAVVRLGVEP